MTKRRYTLRPLWRSVKVWYCWDGTLVVKPQWRKGMGNELSKIAASERLRDLINAHLRRRKQ